MSQHEAFLRSIVETPDDDAPRLVYADWLEDNGEPHRAEFIRIQCRLAALDEDAPKRRELQRREYELLADHWGEWAAPFVGVVERWQFRRGFVEQIKASTSQFLKGAKRLLELAPIREVRILYPEADEVRALCASKHLRRITRLDLDHASIGDAGVSLLVDSANVGQLTHLSLKWNELNTAGLLAVATSARLASLRSVTLYEHGGGRCEDGDFRAFVTACRLPSLEHLEWSSLVSSDSIRALLASPLAGQLKRLSFNRLDSDGLRLMAASNALARLETLEVSNTDLDRDSVRQLAASSFVRRLGSLSLHRTALGDAGAVELARAPAGSLRRLNLTSNKIGPEGAEALAKSPLTGSLTRLNLSFNPIGNAGLKALLKPGRLDDLLHLDLCLCDVTYRGVKSLESSELLEQLSYLGLEDNEIGKAAFGRLRDRIGDRLDHDLFDAGLKGDEIIRRVRAEPPRCVRGLGANPDTELLRRFPRQRLHPLEYATIAFELTHPDPQQRATLLGYDLNNLFISPYAIRWEPSGQQREFFDAEQHGRSAEHDGNCTVTGSGKRQAWKCGRPGCRDHRFVVTFIYRIEYPPRRYHDRHLPLADQFYHIDLDAYCGTSDAMEHVATFECK